MMMYNDLYIYEIGEKVRVHGRIGEMIWDGSEGYLVVFGNTGNDPMDKFYDYDDLTPIKKKRTRNTKTLNKKA